MKNYDYTVRILVNDSVVHTVRVSADSKAEAVAAVRATVAIRASIV